MFFLSYCHILDKIYMMFFIYI